MPSLPPFPLSCVRPNILALTPYSTARDEYTGGDIHTWLDANESPYDNGVNRYPDPHRRALRAEVARVKHCRPEEVFVGNGSDEAIDLCYRVFCRPGIDNAVSISPTYGMYAVCAAVNDVELREVPLGADFSLPEAELLGAADENTRLMWICSPNNPTGAAFPLAQLERLADAFRGILVVDEAYADFSERGSLLAALQRHPNLIVLQTLSKAWGMAGLRVGLAFTLPELVAVFDRVKYPYNVSGPVQAEALRRLRKGVDAQVSELKSERARLARLLPEVPCVEAVYPTDANFFLIRTASPDRLYDHLIAGGVIVRNRHRVPGCEGCLRITIGTPRENDRMMELLHSYSC